MNLLHLIALAFIHPEYGWMVASGLVMVLAIVRGGQI